MLDSSHNRPAVNRANAPTGPNLNAASRDRKTSPSGGEAPAKIEFPSIDIDTIFWVARQKGFVFCELYSELVIETHFRSQDRIEDVRIIVAPGASLRCHDGERIRIFKTNSVSTQSLTSLLGESSCPTQSAPKLFTEPFEIHDPALSPDEKFQVLSQLARQLWAEERAGIPQFQYEEHRRFFLIADTNDRQTTGCDEAAWAVAKWTESPDGRPVERRFERSRLSPGALIADLQNPIHFKEPIEALLSNAEKWPAPQGELPVLWSAPTFAKLNLHLLRAFEGDLFLSGRSFLTNPLSLPFHYQIQETLNPNLSSVDYEGSARRAMTILQDGKPRGLACNRSTAAQLSVSPTGHSRRQTFHSPGTVGFWNPKIVPVKSAGDPLLLMDRGISVRDIEIHRYSTATGRIDLTLKEAYLVHNGEQGERIEPVRIQASLPQLLQSCHQFSTTSETLGFRVHKQGQDFITEIESPSALSLPVNLPGSVPPNNYW